MGEAARNSPPNKHPEAMRRAVLATVVATNQSQASIQHGIALSTVRDWVRQAKADGEILDPASVVGAKAAANTRTLRSWTNIARQKEDIACRLAEEIHDQLDQLHLPHIEKIVKARGTGNGQQTLEVVEVQHDRPPTHAQKQIMTTVAIAIDKMQVLTGGVTERIGVEGDADARREELGRMADLLAERRAKRTVGGGDSAGTGDPGAAATG